MVARSAVRVLAATVVGAALFLAAGSPAAAAWRRDTTPPTTPPNLRVTAVTHTSLSVAWSASTDNVKVASYVVWAPGASVVSVPHPQTTATLAGLEPGTAYQVRVRAVDSSFNASADAVVDATTTSDVTPPSTPTGLTLTDTVYGRTFDPVTASTVLLRWTSGTDDFHPVRHEVLVNGVVTPNAFDARTQGTPFASTSIMWVRQLEPGTTYEFRVRAVDPSGNRSGPSAPVTVTTDTSSDTTPPTAVTLLRASDGGTAYCPEELELLWTGSTDDVDATTAIEYEVRVNGTITDVISGITQHVAYTETDGRNEVTIVAVDRSGNAAPASNMKAVNVGFSVECQL